MFPGVAFEAACARLKQAGSLALQPGEVNEYQELKTARQAIAEEIQSNAEKTLPKFLPQFEVEENKRYGHIIYQKAAALTDAELTKVTGKSAQSLGLVPWPTENLAFESNTNYYVVSLQDLPPTMRDSVRKIKIYHELSASRSTLTLNPDTMLSPLQGTTCFQHVASQYSGSRPAGFMSGNLKTIPELIQLAQLMDNVMQEQMEQDAEAGDDSALDALAGKEGEEQEKSAQLRALAGLNLDPEPMPKKAKNWSVRRI